MITSDFLSELRADPRTASIEPQVADAFRALDLEAKSNPHAAILGAVAQAISNRPAPLVQRLRALMALIEHDGLAVFPRTVSRG